MADRQAKGPERRLLWWIAGADGDVLAECPKGDQLFVSHLGIALCCAFLFVFLISAISINVAFPSLDAFAKGWSILFAALIGTTIFLIDRSFIISDWDWQAAQRRDELAKASWETAQTDKPVRLATASRVFSRLRRATAILFRLFLSLAIGYSIASFLELVIYQDEIRPEIEAQHYRDNRPIYDRIGERQRELAYEIDLARGSRDRLAGETAAIEGQITEAITNPPKSPSHAEVDDIDRRIDALEKERITEEAKVRTLGENIVAERFGTKLNDGNTGIEGEGRQFQTNVELKQISEARIATLDRDISQANDRKRAALEIIRQQSEALMRANDALIASLRARAETLQKSLAEAEKKQQTLVASRGAEIAAFTAELKRSPSFVPISYGVASQFRALRTLYNNTGNWMEYLMIKALIMLLELTPIIMKIFLSPKTLYAIKLDGKRRESSYAYLDAELALRQQHLRRKFDAAMDEQMDGRGLEMLRKDNVTPIKEAKGAG